MKYTRMAMTPMMAKTAAGPTPCFVGSEVIHAAMERTSKW